jgi:hypothetical protein
MKLKYIFGGAALALAFIASAQADVTVNITGATAFRGATLKSIKAKFVAGGNFKYAHDQAGGSYSGATRAIFIGTFPSVSGTTTIRCCFTGSVEGIRALIPTVTDPLPPTYYPASVLDGTTATSVGAELAFNDSKTDLTGAAHGSVTDTSHIAFSDVKKSSTPYGGSSLLPADPKVGVIVFTMIGSNGCPISNITSQQFRALLSGGYQPLSMFTGNSTDTDLIFATGRNDGSGTRTTYLAESGYGITKAVRQYVTNVSSNTTLTTIQLVPAGGLNSPALTGQSASNASTVWGLDIAGNGGYNSGSTLKADLGKTGASVTVLDENGDDTFGAPVNATLVTWISVGDAAGAKTAGARLLGYNGVTLDLAGTSNALSTADIAKVSNGAYTAWGYENMYRRNDITSGDALTVYNGLAGAIPTNIGTSGIMSSAMAVFRQVDGGTVAP